MRQLWQNLHSRTKFQMYEVQGKASKVEIEKMFDIRKSEEFSGFLFFFFETVSNSVAQASLDGFYLF